MKGLTKFKKLLCFLIVSIFVFGFGGEIVKADSITTKGSLNPGTIDEFQWKYDATQGLDAFCIDSGSASPSKNPNYSREMSPVPVEAIIPADKINHIINIMKTGEALNLSEQDKYYVTQAAIWYVMDGVYETGHQNGISRAFYNRITTSDKFKDSWKILMRASDSGVDNSDYPKLEIRTDKNDYSMTEEDDYFYSKDITLSAISDVSIKSGSSEGACIYYNGECNTSATIPLNTSFKVRVNKPNEGTGQVSASIDVVSTQEYKKYYLEAFSDLINVGRKIQDVVILKNDRKKISNTLGFNANYTNPKNVEIQKVDADTGLKVAGAKLKVTDSNGIVIGVYTSTAEGETNPTVSLPDGTYYLSEDEQPDGYYYNSQLIQFSVVEEGGEKVVKDVNGNTITPTISFSNKAIKIKFRKLVDKVTYDTEGNMTVEKVPMAGVKFKIVSYTYENSEKNMLCAISDANGYLTQPCPGDEDTHNVNSNGEYILGKDFGKASDIYRIKEYCLTDECKPFVKDSTTGETYGISDNAGAGFQVFNGGRSIILGSDVLSTTYSDDSTPIITINITNQYHIDISKTSITGGDEVPGAIITVTDPSLEFGEGEELETSSIVDSWESGKDIDINGNIVPHTIVGVVPGVKYRLTEEVAPEGYIKMVNSIDFIMDEEGNITTYDIVSGQPITDLNGTDYHLLITNAPTKTIFSKTGVGGEEVADAHLKVCTKDSYDAAKAATGDANNCESFVIPSSNQVVEWTSVAGETKTFDGLPVGEYYLIETIAPVGYYRKTTAVAFNVKDDGSTTNVEMTNELTRLVISKKNQLTGERIAGAKFQILKASDRSQAKDYLGNDLVWTSDGINDWEIMGIPADDYILVETQNPEGFQEGMIIDGEVYNEYKFSIGDSDDDVNIDVDIQVLNAPNTGLSTLNLFAIGGLMIFAGYETIKIYRRKALN